MIDNWKTTHRLTRMKHSLCQLEMRSNQLVLHALTRPSLILQLQTTSCALNVFTALRIFPQVRKTCLFLFPVFRDLTPTVYMPAAQIVQTFVVLSNKTITYTKKTLFLFTQKTLRHGAGILCSPVISRSKVEPRERERKKKARKTKSTKILTSIRWGFADIGAPFVLRRQAMRGMP